MRSSSGHAVDRKMRDAKLKHYYRIEPKSEKLLKLNLDDTRLKTIGFLMKEGIKLANHSEEKLREIKPFL